MTEYLLNSRSFYMLLVSKNFLRQSDIVKCTQSVYDDIIDNTQYPCILWTINDNETYCLKFHKTYIDLTHSISRPQHSYTICSTYTDNERVIDRLERLVYTRKRLGG